MKIGNIAKALIFLGLYLLGGCWGLSMSSVGLATLVWPPTGIAFACIFILGPRYWPIVAIGTFVLDHLHGAPFVMSGVSAVGNSLEALIAYYSLTKLVGFNCNLTRVRDVVAFLFFAVFLSTLVSTIVGTFAMSMAGLIETSEWRKAAGVWWTGDILGSLIIAPLFLVWGSIPYLQFSARKILEAILLALVTLGTSYFVFQILPEIGVFEAPHRYLVFPIVLYACLRFQQYGAVVVSLLISAVGIWHISDRQHFRSTFENLYDLQLFIGSLAIIGLILSAAVRERREAILRLRQANRELLEKNEQLKQFAYITSHDLQEPLRSITSFGDLLGETQGHLLSDEGKEYLDFIVRGAERMAKLVKDLLSYTQIGKEIMKIRPIQLKEILDCVEENLKAGIEQSGTTVIEGDIGQVAADRELLIQVFQNLIGNAIKFRSERPLVIKIHLKERPEDWEIRVADNGIGIDPRYQGRIFEIFQRLDHKKECPGSGIGLSICKKIVEMHNGKIWVESVLGEGSTFVFTLKKPVPRIQEEL